MADPIRLATQWPGWGIPWGRSQVTKNLILREDALRRAVYLIGKHELSVWFEPRWQDARFLARRFRHCAICSIPFESDTFSLHRIPAWRPRRDNGVV